MLRPVASPPQASASVDRGWDWTAPTPPGPRVARLVPPCPAVPGSGAAWVAPPLEELATPVPALPPAFPGLDRDGEAVSLPHPAPPMTRAMAPKQMRRGR